MLLPGMSRVAALPDDLRANISTGFVLDECARGQEWSHVAEEVRS